MYHIDLQRKIALLRLESISFLPKFPIEKEIDFGTDRKSRVESVDIFVVTLVDKDSNVPYNDDCLSRYRSARLAAMERSEEVFGKM